MKPTISNLTPRLIIFLFSQKQNSFTFGFTFQNIKNKNYFAVSTRNKKLKKEYLYRTRKQQALKIFYMPSIFDT